MLYQKEFQGLKAIYDSLPPSSQDLVKILVALPAVAMGIFGAVLMPLGIIGFAGFFGIGLLGAAASAAMVFFAVDLPEETGIPRLKRRILRRPAPQPEAEEAAAGIAPAPLRMAANDPAPPAISLQKRSAG